jgi:hypothetical protein
VAVLTTILEGLARLAAIGLGLWLAYAEATGTYEFYMAKQGSFDFVVKAAVGISLATVLLPHFLGRAIRERRLLRAAAILTGFALAVVVVLSAGVHRTGSTADLAEAERAQVKRQLDAAKANVNDAEAALADDKSLKKAECKTGVGNECKKLAQAGREALATTIELRKQYADTKEPPEDNTPKRLSALIGGLVNPEQVRTFHPMLVPIAVAFIAGLCITIGLETPLPSKPMGERKPWRWRRKEAEANRQVDTSVIDAHIVSGDLGVFLTTSLQPGKAVREDDVCLAYEMWCAAHGYAPIPRTKFKAAFVKLCRYAGFKRSKGRVYGMELVVPAQIA